MERGALAKNADPWAMAGCQKFVQIAAANGIHVGRPIRRQRGSGTKPNSQKPKYRVFRNAETVQHDPDWWEWPAKIDAGTAASSRLADSQVAVRSGHLVMVFDGGKCLGGDD